MNSILAQAAEVMRAHGHTSGTTRDHADRVCLVGAVNLAAYGHSHCVPKTAESWWHPDQETAPWRQLSETILDQYAAELVQRPHLVRLRPDGTPHVLIGNFNDELIRTTDEAVTLLEKAAHR